MLIAMEAGTVRWFNISARDVQWDRECFTFIFSITASVSAYRNPASSAWQLATFAKQYSGIEV
jgi:hypothetical protein